LTKPLDHKTLNNEPQFRLSVMVFNWFRRQFTNKAEQSEEALDENVSSEVETEVSESEAEQPEASSVDQDYLSWAKAAYQNIQKQQQASPAPAETVSETVVAEELAEPAQVEETVAISEAVIAEEVAEESVITESASSPVEAEAEPAQPEAVAEIEAEPAQPEAVAETEAEPAQPEAVAEIEAEPAQPEAVAETEAEPAQPEAVAETEAEPAQPEAVAETEAEPAQPEAVAEIEAEPTQITTESAAAPSEASESEPVSETPSAPLSFLERAQAEREARLERIKATAIDTPEPDVYEQVPMAQTATQDFIPELAFDEGFLWSAEVLAAQGRRPDDISIEEITWLKKLRQGLDKTRRSLMNQLKAIVGQGPLNQAAVRSIEDALLQADVGVEATDYIIEALQKKLKEEALPPEKAIAYLKQILRQMLDQPTGKSIQLSFAPEKEQLNIWLMTGVNGAGKTTTLGKIAHLGQKSGYNCLIAAADTFRAAAVEQVQVWGERSGVEVIANPGKNTDPAAVVFDAIAAAQARGTELLLIDTAGRLQNKKNLMEELSKIRRIIDKKAPDAKIESLLVLDATLGQNGLRQAEVFSEVAQLSGVVLTKLDGTAKGGVALAVVKQMGLPIRFIGAGEGIEDLRPFSSYEFVEALLSG
jgi:fused signal recognition particle receptor